MSRNISTAFADDGDDKPSRKAHKIAAVAATVAASVSAWFSRRVAIAAAVLRKIGAVTRGADGKDYVVEESARRKIANLLQHHPAADLPAATYFTQAEWQSIPPCPIQRDTEKHLNRCREKFFTVTVSQKTVFIAVQDDGEIYKLEGHTRTYGWENGLVPADQIPELLNVVIHFTEDYDGTLSEYKTFDDSTQSKNGSDQLFAAYRENDLHPVPHGFLYNCTGVVDALRTAFTTLAQHEIISKSMLKRATETQNLKKRCPPKLEECVKRFKPALKALDRLNPPARLFKGVVTRVFLLAYTKYVVLGLGGPDAEKRLMAFFTDYSNGNGKEVNGKSDALHDFRKLHDARGGGEKQRAEKMPKLLGAIERYIENGPNRLYTVPGAVNMEIYFTSRTALNKGNGAREKSKKKKRS